MTEWYHQGLAENLKPGVRVSGDEARILIRTIEDRTAALKANKNFWGETEAFRWMIEEDYNRAVQMANSPTAKYEYREAKLHVVGCTARGHALINGYTKEEADIISGWTWDYWKDVQLRSTRGLTLDTLRRDALDFAIRNNAGQFTTALGALVTLIPGYGTIIGGAMIIGGQAVTYAQGAEITKRAALTKKRELIAARTAFMKGETSEAAYLEAQAKILEGVGQELYNAGGLGALTVMDDFFLAAKPPSTLDRVRGFFYDMADDPAMTAFALAVGATGGIAIWKAGAWADAR